MKPIKTVGKIGGALCLYALTQASANAAFVVYTDESAWQAAVGSFETEDFEDLTLQSPLSTISSDGNISGGLFNDQVNDGPVLISTSFNFDPGVWGVGGTWDLSPGGAGTGISVTTTAGTFFIGEIVPNTNGFWGFVIDETIESMNLSEGSCINNDCTQPGAVETYTLDNLHMATSPVPVPAAVWLFGSGLIGLVGIARRKKGHLDS